MSVLQVLEERGKQYGSFVDFSEICDSINQKIEDTPGWPYLMSYQKEAIRMIVHKMARILNGNPDYVDSWDDIAGYATLVSTILRGDPIPGVEHCKCESD